MFPKDAHFEKQSSAATLSDMEIFVFPELIYSLLLANLMSPRIWRWREDPWFAGLAKMSPGKRIARLKQFIMDHYAFNLDLETWGLTTTERELARFREFISPETLAQSNALFGYEGDKYYFDIDIRTHFGLDRYTSNIIPYWKTETVEAMDAFRFRQGYATGAGECVSLSTLYAAALFIVCGVPLRDLYLLATPLHSQNFVDVGEGVLTNNRRLVTKAMWFNGTALSAQARRALDHERVTLVAHASGHIHVLYEEATIDPAVYAHFSGRLRRFLATSLDAEILGNFVRHATQWQKCFQVRWPLHGRDHYVRMETVLSYEADCSFKLTDQTRPRLMDEVDREEFFPQPLPGRIVFNDLEDFVRQHRLNMERSEDVLRLTARFACDCLSGEDVIGNLCRFCRTEPRLPDASAKRFLPGAEPLGIEQGMEREDVVRRIESLRARNAVADLAFHAYRDLRAVPPGPFLAAALLRSPVSVAGAASMSDADAARWVAALPGDSIYDGPGRLAQPDEVWNFGRGDGVERALLLANLLRARHPDLPLRVEVEGAEAALVAGAERHVFPTAKGLPPQVWELPEAAP